MNDQATTGYTPPASAIEWLRKWDANEIVDTIEMDGLGPGYEQAIQITAAEVLRWLLKTNPDPAAWQEGDKARRQTAWDAQRDATNKAMYANKIIDDLRITGAQAGAAKALAYAIYLRGTESFKDKNLKDRQIMAQRKFP